MMAGVAITSSEVSIVIRENRDLIRGNKPVQIRMTGSRLALVYEAECFSATLTRDGWLAGAANTLFEGQRVSDQKASRLVRQLFDRARSEL
jgi:hypothetical protein